MNPQTHPAGRRKIPHQLFLLTASWSSRPASIDSAMAEDAERALGGFFESYCVQCHGSEKQKGNFRLDNLSTDFYGSAGRRAVERSRAPNQRR